MLTLDGKATCSLIENIFLTMPLLSFGVEIGTDKRSLNTYGNTEPCKNNPWSRGKCENVLKKF